jgi:hypothetical protein
LFIKNSLIFAYQTNYMKYCKLLLNIPDGKGNVNQKIEWSLVIDNLADLLKYAKLDTELTMSAFMRITPKPDKSGFEVAHVNDVRVATVATLLNIKLNATNEGEKMYPIVEIAGMLDRKTRGMIKYIENYGAIRINEVGGYCGLDNYLDTWNGKILETIEKEDVGFPIEKDALNAEVLIIENQDRVNKSFTDKVKELTQCEPQFITFLKEKDQTWVVKSIMNANTIAFTSSLIDVEQINKFMTLFITLPKKKIIIKTYEKSVLMNHSLWSENNSKHEIIFVD